MIINGAHLFADAHRVHHGHLDCPVHWNHLDADRQTLVDSAAASFWRSLLWQLLKAITFNLDIEFKALLNWVPRLGS